MSNYTGSNGQSVRRRAGLYLHPYTMEAMRDRRIRPRQAILLAHVDRWLAPYWTRHPEDDDEDAEPPDHRDFRVDFLREILNATSDTARSTIEELCESRPRLLQARKIDRWWWRLKTPPLGAKVRQAKPDVHTLYVPPQVRQGFEEGELSPMEMLLMGKVACFSVPAGGSAGRTWTRSWLGDQQARRRRGSGGRRGKTMQLSNPTSRAPAASRNEERTTMTPMRAIRAKCLECSAGSPNEVRLCPVKDCPLWP